MTNFSEQLLNTTYATVSGQGDVSSGRVSSQEPHRSGHAGALAHSIFSLPFTLWDDYLVPRISRASLIQLSATCTVLRAELSPKIFASLQIPIPSFNASERSSGTQNARGTRLLGAFASHLNAMSDVLPFACDIVIGLPDGGDDNSTCSPRRDYALWEANTAVEYALSSLSAKCPSLRAMRLEGLHLEELHVHSLFSVKQLECLELLFCSLYLRRRITRPKYLRDLSLIDVEMDGSSTHFFEAVLQPHLQTFIGKSRGTKELWEELTHVERLENLKSITVDAPQSFDPLPLLGQITPSVLEIDLHVRPRAERAVNLPLAMTVFPSLLALATNSLLVVEQVLDARALERMSVTLVDAEGVCGLLSVLTRCKERVSKNLNTLTINDIPATPAAVHDLKQITSLGMRLEKLHIRFVRNTPGENLFLLLTDPALLPRSIRIFHLDLPLCEESSAQLESDFQGLLHSMIDKVHLQYLEITGRFRDITQVIFIYDCALAGVLSPVKLRRQYTRRCITMEGDSF